MSGDSYFRHKVVMEVGRGKVVSHQQPAVQFKDDRELLSYLLEQERSELAAAGIKRAASAKR